MLSLLECLKDAPKAPSCCATATVCFIAIGKRGGGASGLGKMASTWISPEKYPAGLALIE